MPDHNEEIAGLIADAIGRRQPAPLVARMAPGALVWHNSDRREMDAAVAFSAVAAAPMSIAMDQRRVIATPDAVVIQFIMRIAAEDPIELHCCMVVSVQDGQITRIDEYLDPAAASMVDAEGDAPDLQAAR
jgi:ketosteroid isomerase-like protein